MLMEVTHKPQRIGLVIVFFLAINHNTPIINVLLTMSMVLIYYDNTQLSSSELDFAI